MAGSPEFNLPALMFLLSLMALLACCEFVDLGQPLRAWARLAFGGLGLLAILEVMHLI